MLSVLLTTVCQAQKFSLSGYVRDAANGESLIGVNVSIPEMGVGTSTNLYGYYSLELPPGKYEVDYQYIGYESKNLEITLNQDIRKDVELSESTTELQEVQVTSERLDKNVTSVEMSVAKLDVKEIQKVPQLLGETDIIRTLTLLPGVATVGEGSNGFNVRGGAADQNLILLDEAPVYNSSHLFGFFSIFNADAVKDVKLYKGGIPAQYGGRLSSVVDVRQKEGNAKRLGVKGGIGLLSSRLLVEGPIVKDKTSFMVAGRRSYADIFLGLSNNPDLNQNILFFYDLNLKVNTRINENNNLFLSGYFGRDVFGIENLFGFDWGNGTGTLRWNHLFSEKLFSNLSIVYSDYTYRIGTPEDEEGFFELTSRIQDFHLKNNFNYYLNSNNQLDFGFEGIYYRFSPGRVVADGLDEPIELQNEFALEPSVYISHEVKPGVKWTVKYGLRYSLFYKLGPLNGRNYQDPQFPEPDEVSEEVTFSDGEVIAAFDGLQGLEPRLAVNYLLDESRSLKLSYNRTRQYIHLISNTNSPTPIDLYRPAGRYIDPATVNQIAGGYFQNFDDNTFEFSVELYYKTFDNLIDYRPGADLIFNEYIETEILSGVGRAYGTELLLRKQTGKLTGWLSYTLSRTERKVTGDGTPQRSINNGDWYLSNYDKLHDVSLVLNYQIGEQWDLGGTFVFQTGRPYTPPEGKFVIEEVPVPIYSTRNKYRIPSYHRLDLSLNYNPERKEGKRFYSSWSFGLYNVYARRNAYSIFFRPETSDPDIPDAQASAVNTQAVRLAIFGTVIPFVTWNFEF